MSTPCKYYLAGPMSGIPQFNFPAFDAAAADLRSKGYEIISPAELDSKSVRKAALASKDGKLSDFEDKTELTWGMVLSRDVQIVADEADAVIVLPGWEKSKGAKLEVFVALLGGKNIFVYAPNRKAGIHLIQSTEALDEVYYDLLFQMTKAA